MESKKQIIDAIVVPISWVVAAIVATCLGCCGYDWLAYLIGVFTGLLNYGIMVKTNRKMVRMAELYPETAKILAKRTAWTGVLLRMLVFMGVFLALFFKEVYRQEEVKMWILLIAFSGYMTIKVVLIAVYLIFRKKVNTN